MYDLDKIVFQFCTDCNNCYRDIGIWIINHVIDNHKQDFSKDLLMVGSSLKRSYSFKLRF